MPAVPQGVPRPALTGETHEGGSRRKQLRVQRLRQIFPGQALAHETRPKRPPPDEGGTAMETCRRISNIKICTALIFDEFFN